VVLNAGVALYAANVAPSMVDGIQLARGAIESGAAKAKRLARANFKLSRRLARSEGPQHETSDILDKIVAVKREEVAAAIQRKSLAVVRADAEAAC
jgi:hypothetical protein